MDQPNDSESLLEAEHRCWRIAHAERVGLIVDAADYFAHLRRALMAARHEVLLIGWDFDFEIDMLPGESDAGGTAPDGLPNALGDFLEAVVARTPDLRLYLLKWNGSVLVTPGRLLPALAFRIWTDERIRFALDGHHPFGACHHQKIIVIDNALAFCGGIDITEGRWDTSEHVPDDPHRRNKDGSPAEPWHDATLALTGPAAKALGELSRTRWRRATDETLERPDGTVDALWPDGLPVTLRDVDVAVARTAPPYDGEPLVNEIEQVTLAAIAAAREVVYIESQYFAAETVCAALERRLREPNGPEVIVINPEAALSVVEDRAMHSIRGRMIRRLQTADREKRFRIWHPVNAAGEPIYVHAKILIVDDRLFKIGSSNLDDRSMGFDTECDVAFEGRDAASAQAIIGIRSRLLAEHLGTSPQVVEETRSRTGSLIGTIVALNPSEGRGLRAIEPLPEGLLGGFFADTRLLDPRYRVGQPSIAGRGLRPRHLVIGTVAVGLCLGLWMTRRRWSSPRRPG
ncbi:phospholipase D-like domain-containing protein [uncultured Jannaschia sp.]|uniref:phospholipase D-like domain-containing protein n=1 Tax=uncultured Jannaschia sp. TaxID=293347 RepID=UPI00262CBEDD|nr:phospholipase D-like domain-containing protein [uncultured Jannaschia sp.]